MFSNLKGLVKKEGTKKGESERTDADIAFETRTSSVQLKPTSPSVASNHGRTNDITESNSDSNAFQNKSPTSKETDNVKLLKCTGPFGELDDSDCGSVMSSTFRLSTETSDIQSRCQRVYQMARNYKIKYQQLVEAYKVMESERNNLQQLLASHQAKTSKSVDEMYKKLELDKQTKDELERDFRRLLSEKEEIIKSLRLQCDQQNINKLRSELADSKLSQAALQEQVQCLKAQFYSNSSTEETGLLQNESSNKLLVRTESNYIHRSDEIINKTNEQSNEIKSLSCQLEKLNQKLADSEDIRIRLDKEVNELKSALGSKNFKLFIELLLYDTLKTIQELKCNCNDKQSVIECLQSQLTTIQSNEEHQQQEQQLLTDQLNQQINNLHDDYSKEVKKYSDLELKYNEVQVQLNTVQNHLESTNALKEELEVKITDLLKVQSELETMIQSLQQTLNTTKNQFESIQTQFINKCESESVSHNTELQNIQTELTEAYKRIENLQCQLYSSIEQNTHLAKTMEEEHVDTLSEYQQHVYELIKLSNEACELLLKQSEQLSNKLNPIWNILETADQRLALINTNIDSVLVVTCKRFQTYATSVEQLQNELTILKSDLVTRNDVVNDLNMELEKKQDEINNLHLTLDKYNSFNQTIHNFICNDHRQLYQSLIKLCQSKITWILTEMNQSKQNLNNTDIENNNNEQDLYNEYNQIELDAKTLNESFNTMKHLIFSDFNAEHNVNSLELFCNWLNSESYTTSTDHLFKDLNKLDILDIRSQTLHKECINHFKHSIVHNHRLNTNELHVQLDSLKNHCNELNSQLIQAQLDNQKLAADQKSTDEKFNSIEGSLIKANQTIDELKRNESILKENYTNQLKLFEESQQTIYDLNKQLELITEKSNRLSKELTEKETVLNNTLEESDKVVSSLNTKYEQLQSELQKVQLEHANMLENYKTKYTNELNDLNKKYEMEKSQCIEQLNVEHQTALKNAVDTAVFTKEKQMKQQNSELRNRLKQVLQELETSKKLSATPSRREIELQNILHGTEEKLKQLQLEYADQCKSLEELQIKIEELESMNMEINDNSKKNQQDLWDHNCDSISEIHENYQMQIELLKTEQANCIQEMTREFGQKLSTKEREVIAQQKIENDQTLTKLKQMEQSHSEKLAYFEETISDYDRQNTRLKNRISELQLELKRLTDNNNNTVEARHEPIKVVDTPLTTSTQSMVSRHDVDVQCDIKLNENNALINTTTNTNICNHENGTASSTKLCSEVNNNTHLQSNDEHDDWIEKVRQEILQSDSIDSLHPALRQSRYPTSVPIRDYEALQLHNTDLQNQLQQLSADFEALRSKCTAACSSASNKNSLSESLHIHTVDNTVRSNNYSLSFNSIPPDYQHVLLTSPSDNRLHELVEYEYLKNVLFEYMQGRETQTLSKVLCSLMRFNADQTRKVLTYEDQKSKTWTIRTAME
ncbi:hypothetical protein Smp_023940 [Schistosoma mansoni]|uniref:hypothetical protein n=1 Tax=Schistosoma mansoni TaxID=6183 RepID=UPI0001A63001|nr:hypothetical protein Smp_023940 [Schistosoma mansoni]|eukprot:XP_018650410.1 hypothetical protein Smp_023940 [Schistosoma mansoni]